jgi:hypothetical protein
VGIRAAGQSAVAAAGFRLSRSEAKMKQPVAMKMQLSATLNAGQGLA